MTPGVHNPLLILFAQDSFRSEAVWLASSHKYVQRYFVGQLPFATWQDARVVIVPPEELSVADVLKA